MTEYRAPRHTGPRSRPYVHAPLLPRAPLAVRIPNSLSRDDPCHRSNKPKSSSVDMKCSNESMCMGLQVGPGMQCLRVNEESRRE